MKYIFTLGHPAHFYLFRQVINNLKNDGHDVMIVITDKDILRELLDDNHYQYEILSNREHKDNLFLKAIKIAHSTESLIRIVKIFHPDLMIGCLSQMAYVTKITNIPSIFCGEDDYSYMRAQYHLTCPWISCMLAPSSTNVGPYESKRISYNGYHKLSYLHPNVFTPNSDFVGEMNPPYSLVRLVSLSAHHDVNAKGISLDILDNLIDILKPYGNVYLSTEKQLPSKYQEYKLPINVSYIHHALYFAQIYIGDSQSMAVEAAMLGVPSIRFNSFAGKIGVLQELELKYQLTFGISPSDPELLYSKSVDLLSTPNLFDIFQNRRRQMLADKIDVSAFFTWFVENYPESKKIMKENPDYQYRFK
jgi:Uncharacterized protein conserved in archaea